MSASSSPETKTLQFNGVPETENPARAKTDDNKDVYPVGQASDMLNSAGKVEYLSIQGLKRFWAGTKWTIQKWITDNYKVAKITVNDSTDNVSDGSTGVLNISSGASQAKTKTKGGHISVTAKNGSITIDDTLTTLTADSKNDGLLSVSDYQKFTKQFEELKTLVNGLEQTIASIDAKINNLNIQ